MLNRDVEEIVRLIRSGRLSASEEVEALSALHRNLSESETGNDSGVVYATPYWSAEPAPTSRQSAVPQVAIVLDLASVEAGRNSLVDALLSSLRIPGRIDLRENDRRFADLSSSDEPEAKLSEIESLRAISLRSFESVLLLIVDDLSLVRRSGEESDVPDETGRVFLGKLLYVFGVVQTLLNRNASADIRCVTLSDHRCVLSVGAAVSGLLKALVLEHRRLSGRTIWAADLQANDRSATAFLSEELCGMEPGSHLEVRLRDGSRYVRRFRETEIAGTNPTSQSTLQSGDAVLVSGGLGGVGRILVEYLVSERGARLALAGRTAPSMLGDEQAAFLQRYASDVAYLQADIAVPEQVRSLVVAAKQRFGRIDGVIHAAGVTRDGWLFGKRLSSVRDVLRPKVLGAYYLGESFGAGLKFFVHFSSLASYRGNTGQSEYACANAFLDHHIAVRNELRGGDSPRCANLTINWPLWKSGGMRPSLTVREQMERAFGLRALGSRQGARCFEAALASGYGQVLVAAGDTTRLRTHFLAQKEEVEETRAEQPSPNGRREGGEGDEAPTAVAADDSMSEPAGAILPPASLTDHARKALLDKLTSLVAETMALQSGEIEPDASLSEYGFDSISLTELAAKISRAYEWIELDATVFLVQPTLRELCEHLLTKYASKFTTALGSPPIDGQAPSERRHSESRARVMAGTANAKSSGDIAIIGVGGRFPGARDAIELWKNLGDGVSCISKVPSERWDWREYSGDPTEENRRTDCHYGAFIEGIECFDPLHFDISPREAELMDPQQRLLLQGAWETIENAGYSRSALANRRVGVFIGVEKHDYLSVIGQSGVPLDGYINTGNSHSMLVNRVSYFFDWNGPSVALDTACSSSFSALSAAIRSLRCGESTLALAGGVNVLLAPGVFVINRKMRMLTADDHVKPFDATASGHLYGEGLGLVLLKPLSTAILDRDCIYGVIKGMSVRHGGRGVFLTAPNGKAHVEVIEEALSESKLAPEEIDYIEAQGSADRLADRIELRAYHTVFGPRKSAPVRIGSIKGHTGHMGAASGVIGLIKAILSLRNNRLIGIINLRSLNWDNSDGKFGCAVLDTTTDWEPKLRGGTRVPRNVGIHNFGYGGVNGHLILEEFLGSAGELDDESALAPEIVLLSARTEEQIGEVARRLSRYLLNREHQTYGLPTLRLMDIAYTLVVGREALDVRAALLVRDSEQLIDKLERLGHGEERVEGCYKGCVNSKKDLLHSWATEDALTRAVAGWVSSRNVESLADAWVKGTAIDWQQLFDKETCCRVPLPTYPFATGAYWVPRRDGQAAEANGTSGQKRAGRSQILHPLLHTDTSSGSQYSFQSVFSGEEPSLRDHLIQGQRVLPGVAYLEMARDAVHRWACCGPEDRVEVELRNVVWMRPVVVGPSPQTVDVRLYPLGEREARFEILTPSETPRQKATTHCQGTAVLRDHSAAKSVDLAALRVQMDRRSLVADQVYEAFGSTGVAYGPFYRGIETIHVGDDQVLARLVQPSSFGQLNESAATEPFFLHPSLMDSALQAIIGLAAGASGAEPVADASRESAGAPTRGAFLPFALESLTIIGPTPRTMWAWIRTSVSNRGKDGLQKVDIDLCTDTGDVRVSWRGLSNRQLEPTRGAETILESEDREEGAIHPVSHDGCDSFESRFLSHFSGNEYYLADHGGMLLGAAYLEMARAAGELGGHEVVGLSNVVWMLPIKVGDGGGKVWTRLQRERDRVEFRICTTNSEGDASELIHSQGRLVLNPASLGTRPVDIDTAAIRTRCRASANASECASALRLTHGQRVLSVERLHYSDQEAIAELKLPPGAGRCGKGCRLHPSMLNGALVASVLPSLIRQPEASLPAPFALQELWIYGEIPDRAYAYVRPAADCQRSRSASSASLHDIDVTDLDGQVVISLKGLWMTSPAAVQAERDVERRIVETSSVPETQVLEGAVLRRLVMIVSQRQKLKIDDIDPDRQLTRYGFDSVGFTELGNRLNTELGLDVMPTVFFEYPDLRSLAGYLADAHAGTLLAHPDFHLRPRRQEKHEVTVDRVTLDNGAVFAVRRQRNHRWEVDPRKREPIAVTGMNGRFPGSPDLKQFWRNIEANLDLITEVPKDRWDWRNFYGDPGRESGRTKVKWGGFIEGVDRFDPLFFGISPLEAEALDPQLRILLEATWAAIEDAGYRASSLAGTRIGLFVGVSTADYKELWQRANDPVKGVHGLSFAIANRVSYSFDFRGPSEVIDTACSSSLIAVHRAIESIRHGSCDMALAAGVNVMATPTLTLGGSQAGMLGEDGRCKTFDSRADGYGRGEGVGVVCLKPLTAAIEAGDRIHGLILGSAENHGGRAASPTAPNPASQCELLVAAYTEAGVDPRTVGYIEAHGTGTQLGDPIEVEGLKAAFSQLDARQGLAAPDRPYCALGSVKTNVGHLEAAAGISGLIKVLLMMKHRKIPGNVHLRQENELLRMAGSPFYLAKETAEWRASLDENGQPVPRRAGISSFGIGGSNAHVVVEEHIQERDDRPQSDLDGPHLVVLSAKTSDSLTTLVRNLQLFAIAEPSTCLADLAYTLQCGREAMEERLAFVAESMQELEARLSAYLAGECDSGRFHRAAVRDHRESMAAFASDEDMTSTIGAWMAKGKHARLLEAWAKGLDVDWGKLPRKALPVRIALPTYPFARERYWVPEDSVTSPDRVTVSAGRLHPLVHRNTSELSQQRFSSRFTGREFFLADHVIERQCVLPAVAYLEMARAAVELSVGPGGPDSPRLRLRNVVWARPLTVSSSGALDVHIALAPDRENGIRFEVYTSPVDGAGEMQVHCQGLANVEAAGEIQRLDLENLRVELATNRIGAEECYKAFGAAGIEYGPAFRGIDEVFYNSGQVLASLHVPLASQSSSSDGVDAFGLHPALLDSALQACFALSRNDPARISSPRKVSLPFALEECEIFAACTSRMVAWIRHSAGSGVEDRLQKVDLDLCSEDGRVCVRLKGLSARVKEADERQPSAMGLALYHPYWKNETVPAGIPLPDHARHVVMLCDGVPAAADIRNGLAGVDCIPLDPAGNGMAERFEEVALKAFDTIKTLVAGPSKGTMLIQVLVPRGGEKRLFSGLSGLLMTAQLEQPRIRTQLVEVDPQDSPASLCAAIRGNALRPEDSHIRYELGRRQIMSWRESAPLEGEAPPPWKDGGVYLITGGAGGLGLIFAKEIANRTSGAVLILAGRSDLTGAQRGRIDEMRSVGATVSYRRVDVSRLVAVEALVAEIEETHGRLDGVIHCAGLLRDEFILRKSADSFREVLAPKVAGTLHLDQATCGMALDFFVLFSSGSGAFGNVGQADYATANAFMDAFAIYRADLVAKGERHGRTISIDWPLWEQGGMQADEATRERLRTLSGVVPLRTSSGIDAFYRILAAGDSQALVLEGEMKRIRALFDGDNSTAQPAPSAVRTAGTSAARGSDEAFETRVAVYLKQVVSTTLKLPVARVEVDVPLERYGIDSIVVMQLTNRLEETFGSLSKTLFFEYRTLTELSRYFVETHAAKLRELLGADQRQAPAVAVSSRAVDEPSIKRNRPVRFAARSAGMAPESVASPLDIAIIGLAGRYPESRNLEEYWENLRDGRNCITEVPPSRWNWRDYYTEERGTWGHYSKWGGFIADVDKFDPLFFGISPREAEFMDPQERLFLEHAWMALEDAGYRRADLQKGRENELPAQVGVYAGAMFGEYQLLGLEAALSGRPVATASSYASIANRVSYVLNLHGPSMTVDTMCSSSLTSLHLACQDLKHGQTDLALAGGVNISIHPNKYFLLSGGQFISSQGRCASFGAGGDGYVPGEGVGVAVLKRLADAERDGDHIYGVIKGSSVNHGGKTNGYSVPNPNAQQMAIANALRESGIDPRRISYVEAHGTGTVLGDPIEITGLTKAFRRYTEDSRYCWIGSAKSNIGHCESAAGIAGVTKILLQMKHGELAPSIHSATLNPYIDFDATPFIVNQERRTWERPVVDDSVTPRIAAVSSFGAGGSNAHLVIEEYRQAVPPRASRPAHRGPYAIVLSARNKDRLNEYAAKLLAFVRSRSRRPIPSPVITGRLKNDVESAARRHLSGMLGVDAAQIGMEQRLQEYGVEPFDKSRLLAALQSELELDIDLNEFTGKDSIAEIAGVFMTSAAASRPSMDSSPRDGAAVAEPVPADGTEATPGLAEIAYTLQVGREAMEERLGLLVESFEELESALSDYLERSLPGTGQGKETSGLGHVYRGHVGRHKESLAVFERDDDMAGLVRTWIDKRKFDRTLDLWVKGFEFDWASLYGDVRPPRTSLPTYPFARERYWIETPTNSESGPKSRMPASTPNSSETAVVACSPVWQDRAADVGRRATDYSNHVVLLTGPSPCSAEEIESSLNGVRCVQLRSESGRVNDHYRDCAIQAFELIRELLQKGSSERSLIQLVVPPGDEARLLSGLSGLLNSARLENPRLVGQVVELEQGETKAGLLQKIRENASSPDESSVRYTGGRRQVAILEELRFAGEASRPPWRDRGVYLITGGAGGLGLVFAEEIAARAAHATIVLTGRSPESAEIKSRFAGGAFAGSAVEYRQLDACKLDAVERAISEIRDDHGELNGIIHAAGVVRDSLILAKTAREFEEVLGPKVAGTVNLDRATRELDLDFFVLFSSLASLGNPGQSDYAAANGFLDAYADYRDGLVRSGQRRGRTLSIDWPLWRAGGMRVHDDIVAKMTRTTGMVPMQSASGIRAFYRGLASGKSRVMVMEGEPQGIRRTFLSHFSHLPASQPAVPERTDSSADGLLREKVLSELKGLLGEVVKLPSEAVDPEAAIESYGVESVAIGQMNQRLEAVFGELPKTLFYEFPTLDEMATHLMAEYPVGCLTWDQALRTPDVASEPAPARATLEPLATESAQIHARSNGSSAPVDVARPHSDTEPIAIIGLAGRFPGSDSLEEYWENLRTGKGCFTEVPAQRWSLSEFYEPNPDVAIGKARSYCKTGAFLSRFADFDPLFFKIAPVEAYRLDPHERLLLTTCWEAMENSGHSRASLRTLYAGSVGVFVGVTKLGFYLHTQLGSTLETSRLPSTSFSSMANRISYQLNLSGPSMAIDTMCSSSVTAIHEACEHIRRGDCRVAFAASANLYLHPRTYIDLCLGKLVTEEPEPHCFSATGSGFVPGEAVGAMLLKPLAEAVRDGDPIHGVVRATAINHGGRTTGYTAPSLPKQAEVIRLAMERAGGDANSIDFVEAAANGSALGDDIELQALKQVFKSRATGRCYLGTLKASVGHSEAASGIAQLTKVLLQMKHQMLAPTRVLPGTVNGAFNSKESPFELVTVARLWPRRTSPRRALITSFGAGGSYGAMIVEDYAPPAGVPRLDEAPVASSCEEYLFVVSARTEQQLRVYAKRLSAHLASAKDSLASVAYTLQQGRDAMEYGLAIIAPDRATLIEQLEAFVDDRERSQALEAGKAVLFSGRRTNLRPEGVRELVRQAVGKRDLKALAQLWLAGSDDIPWSELYDKPVPRCVLPTYPFGERTFWYDQQPPAAPTNGSSPQLGQSIEKIEKDLSSAIRDILLMSDEDVLDVEANFSELGLDSVNGVHFVRKLAETRGVELRETIIFDHPSVSALARYIARVEAVSVREGASQGSTERSAAGVEIDASVAFKRRLGRLMKEHAEIVPLQVDGDGPLLLCLHPMSGDVGLYAKLAQASKMRYRMIGIKSRGFLSGAEPLDTIPKMAEQAVALATAILPDGIFHLFGSSMGGAVAYECARTLQLRARPVGTLLMVEAPLVENEEDARLWASDSLQNWIMNANFLMIGVLHMDPDFRRRKAAGEVKWSQLEITRSEVQGTEEPEIVTRLVALIKGRGAAMPEESLSVRLRSMAGIHLANLRALSHYRAEPLVSQEGIKAVLVRTQSGTAVSADVYNPDYLNAVQRAKGSLKPFFEGWKRVLPGIASAVVEGENHFDLLSAESSIRHVADVIARSLNVEIEAETAAAPSRSLHAAGMRLQSAKVAIIGMSGRFPGAPNTEALWDLLKRGDCAFTELPTDRGWSLPVSCDVGGLVTPVYVTRGGFLPDIDRFDPVFFGIPPTEAEFIDAAERLFLEETWKAIEDAGVNPASLAGNRWGVFCGGGGDITLRLKELSGVSPHVTASSIPGRVSYSLNLTGPCVAVDAGCASSMLAIAQAADALALGQCDVAIAGGVWVFSTPNMLNAGCQAHLFSQEDLGRALSAKAGGMMAGEAVGALILKPLKKAEADGDRIYGVIEGWGSGHNGRTNGMAAPSVSGQTALYTDVYRRFGIDPATVGLLEANAVGTPLGDTMEVEALTSAFRAATAKHSYCALSTVENNIGHAFQASGIAHVIKVLLALRHQEIPATVNVLSPNAGMNLDRTPFFINSRALPWQVDSGHVRRAATSSFGTTGINVHLVICEAPPAPQRGTWAESATGRFHLIALSAKTKTALVGRCRELLDYVARQGDACSEVIGRISANLTLRRTHFAERCAFVTADRGDLARQLSTIIRGEDAENVFEGTVSRAITASGSGPTAAALTQLVASQRRTDRGSLLALAELYVQGVPLDLAQCFSDAEKTPLSLPSYPFERRRCWPAADRHAPVARGTAPCTSSTAAALEGSLASPTKGTASAALCEIQSIVAEVSGYELSELPLDVPLSRLGLDSLMSMRVLALVNERFSLELHLADLVENGSIQDLSFLIGAEETNRPIEGEAQVVTPASGGVSSRAAWLFRRFAPVPRGLSVKSVKPGVTSASSLKLIDPVARLMRAGIAICHDGVECHFVAHHSVDAIAVYESLSSKERSDLLASLPEGVLVAPISQEQERNLYHSEVTERPSWNLQQIFALRVPIDGKLLDAAMSRLIENQDVLRTHYLRLGDSWAQVVVPEASVAIQNAGITSLQALQHLLETERNKLLDVYRLPILRVWIAEADGVHHLAFVTHHSLADAFTPGMLLSELMTYYDALREARAVPTRQIDEQYWQYALRQFDSTVYRGERTLQYWRDRLIGRATSMRLPYSRNPGEIDPDLPEVSDAEPVSLPPALTEQIERFSREHDVTHTQLFTAAIALALVHGLGNPGALLRSVNSQRSSRSLMNTAGEFTSVSFLALEMDRSAEILDALREVKRRSLESLKFSRVDFRELLRLSDLKDYEGYYRQIGDVMIDSVDIDTGGVPPTESHGRLLYGGTQADSATSVELPAAGTLMFQLLKIEGRVHLLTFFRKHLFEKTVIRDLCDLIVGLVEGMVTQPAQRVSDLLLRADAKVCRLRSHMDRHHVDAAKDANRCDANRRAAGAGSAVGRSAYFTECQRVNAVKHGRPVFWVHGAFGDASVYIPLARQIDRPFYGIQARGLFDDRAPLSGVDAITTFYAGMIEAIQPHGPYDLGGYSIGGIFAYEVARQLVAAGREVHSLCLVDTLFHPYYETLLPCSGGLRETYEFVSLGLIEMSVLQPGAARRLRESVADAEIGDADMLLPAFVDACREAGVAKPRVWIESFTRRMVKLLRGYRIGDYAPRPLSGGIEAVRYFRRRGGWALGGGLAMENGRSEGAPVRVDYWSEWSTLLPNIEYREVVADNHMSILRDHEALRVINESCRAVYHREASATGPVEDTREREPDLPLSKRESPAVKDTVSGIVSEVLYIDVSELDPKRALSSYGMDSFAMTQLLQRLRAAFDLDLDIETMFTLETLSDIAQYVERRMGRPSEPEPGRRASEAQPSQGALARRFPELIRLNRVFEGRPVFWFHGGLGGVESYREIADASRRPFFGIQARGWMTDRAPLYGIQAMTAYYVHIMQSVQLAGPYDVGGYSLGGLIAYEAVRQLQELGESMSTLVMVDTLDSSAFRNASMSNRADMLAWPILNFALQSRAAATGVEPSTLLIHRDELDAGLDGEAKLTQLIALAKAHGLRQPEAQLRAMVRRLMEVHRAYETDRYKIAPLARSEGIDCRYFRNKRGLFLGELEPYYVAQGPVSWDHAVYWAEWLEQLPNLQMTDVDASNHMMLLTEPKARDVIVNSCRGLYS